MNMYEEVINDCLKAIELVPSSRSSSPSLIRPPLLFLALGS